MYRRCKKLQLKKALDLHENVKCLSVLYINIYIHVSDNGRINRQPFPFFKQITEILYSNKVYIEIYIQVTINIRNGEIIHQLHVSLFKHSSHLT